jgi:hypothetical protein
MEHMAINVKIRSAEQVGGQIESEIDVFGTADDRGKDYVLAVVHPPRTGTVASESGTLLGEGRGQLFDTYNVTGPAQTIIGSTPVQEVRARVFESGLLGSRGDLLDEDTVSIDRGAPGPGTGGGEPGVPGGSDPGSPEGPPGTGTPDLSNVSLRCDGVSPQSPEPGGRITAEFVPEYTGDLAPEMMVTYQLLVDGQTAGTAELTTDRNFGRTSESIAGTVPQNLTPGRTVDVIVQAIDIRR